MNTALGLLLAFNVNDPVKLNPELALYTPGPSVWPPKAVTFCVGVCAAAVK